MQINQQVKTIKWLILSSLMAGALTACPDASTGQASFEITGTSLGSSFVDGTTIQPAEAIVKNTSGIAGTPPQVSFNITPDLEFVSIDNALYACDPSSETVLVCTAKDGAKLEGQAQTSLKPSFDLAVKNVIPATALQSKTRQSVDTSMFSISIASAVLSKPIALAQSNATASASGFDLKIGKSVYEDPIMSGTGKFKLTATLLTLSPLIQPNYVTIEDKPLVGPGNTYAGYSYDVLGTTNDPLNAGHWNCHAALFLSLGISCKLDSLASLNMITGEYPPLYITIKVDPSVLLNLPNCSYVLPNLGEPSWTTKLDNNQGVAPYTVPCTPYQAKKADLAITKTQSAPLTTPANSFYWSTKGQYEIDVKNNSTGSVTNASFTDTLTFLPGSSPAFNNYTFTSPSSNWSCIINSSSGYTFVFTCTYLGIVPPGMLPPLFVNFDVKPYDPLTVPATANSETNCATLVNTPIPGTPAPIPYSDANNQNNSSCVDSQNQALEGFDLAIKKKHSNTTVAPGDVVHYMLGVTNNGTGDAPGPITVTDTLPAGFVNPPAPTANMPGGTCTVVGLTVTCVYPNSLPAGSSLTVTIDAKTKPCGPIPTITNTATVSSYLPVGEATLQNNTASDTFALTCQTKSDLAIVKTHENVPYKPGDVVHYFLNVTNNGPQTVTGAVVTDTLPSQFIAPVTWSVNPPGTATCLVSTTNPIVVTCTATTLASGASFTVTINAATDSHTAPGTGIKNTASVSSPNNVDPIPANNTSTDGLTLAQGCTGLTGVQVGTDIVYTFNGVFNTAFGTIPASTAFTGIITYPIQTAVPSQAQYNYTKFTLTVGSNTYSDTGGKLIITDNLSTSIDEFWSFNTTAITGGTLGGITLQNYNGFGLLLRAGNTLWSSPYFPGATLTRPNFTVSAQLFLIEPTPAGSFTHYYDLCAN